MGYHGYGYTDRSKDWAYWGKYYESIGCSESKIKELTFRRFKAGTLHKRKI